MVKRSFLSYFLARALVFGAQSRSHMEAFGDVLPYFVQGEIVKGFGRGSKELGFPTANFPDYVTKNIPTSLSCGVYCGWANVNDGEVYKMVMSIGYNPFYKNTTKSMETYIIHAFNKDLHGDLLKACILRYLRPEMNFSSLDELKLAIKNDVVQAEDLLETPENKAFKSHSFFSTTSY